MALLAPPPETPARSLHSARTSASSLFPFSRLLSEVVDIDELSDDDESRLSVPIAEFGWDPAVIASCLSRGKAAHPKLLLEGRTHVSGVTDGQTRLKPSKLLPRPQPPSVYRPHSRRPPLEREDSVSSSDTLLPIPSPRSKSLEEVAALPEPAALPATRPQSTPPTSPSRKRSPAPLFAPAATQLSSPVSPISPPKSKRRRITPPVSKYKLAAAPGRTRVSLALVVPRNLVNIPPFFPPRARLEAEFALFGYLSHLHECARRGPPAPSPCLRTLIRSGHLSGGDMPAQHHTAHCTRCGPSTHSATFAVFSVSVRARRRHSAPSTP
ncbi:hypothetical protein A1Q1_07315 [Trichosporon asahii var. asahii CBS 2479]|uniref:Uncharacterized protein n=1 Tax=Trichosporon asahii var. asahii (strain ATCC 90039 / CBS 2479 / JCM 2466 / KCTC 7840 / NBRC 103889/ NCYC 2677 / UAMH 7654) TaxID=1186058 RepID=J6F397_TRIAS|nr:hypothetical protein A1Q1_07315 [Trichosporon asahii var. asahii CBS 2479]EJT51464.1 hypothetical protein A1Q1_07315 [Trichosporon asahii var. asahii CBS 2479]